MSLTVAQVNYTSDKNCFISLSTDLAKELRSRDGLQVLELTLDAGRKAFVSWSGETTPKKPDEDGILSISGLYGNTLKIKDGEQLVIKPVTQPQTCLCVYLEPVTPDDWEILEKHASFVESNLLNQVRVVWTGQVLPVWVEKSVCLYLKMGDITPQSDCVFLDTETEVIISPKVRNSTIANAVPHSTNRFPSAMLQTASTNSSVSSQSSTPGDEELKGDLISRSWKRLRSVIFSKKNEYTPPEAAVRDFVDQTHPSDVIVRGKSQLKYCVPNLNLVLRVQPMKITDLKSNGPVGAEIESLDPVSVLRQSSTVFINADSLASSLPNNRFQHQRIFYARIQKLHSPRDVELEKQNSDLKQKNEKLADAKEKEPSTKVLGVVRVVVIDKHRQLCDAEYDTVVERLLQEQILTEGYIIVQDQLRKLLKLDVSGRVLLTSVTIEPLETLDFFLYPVSKLPSNLTRDMVCEAFKVWLEHVSDATHPLLVFQGICIMFPVFRDINIDVQVTFVEMTMDQSNPSYTLLEPGKARHINLSLMSNTGSPSVSHWPIQPMLAYTTLDSFDPNVPTATLEQLGGVTELFHQGLLLIDMCLGSKPLARSMFEPMEGPRNGMLLITGPKGSGKTTLAEALCRYVAESPMFVYFSAIDCKTIKGKKPDSIHRIISSGVNEAVWRQPSIILLENLDHVTGNPSGPEAEMSVEAIYAARIAEVIKDILKKEIQNNSRVCFLATAQSRSSLNRSLVSSRGTHFIQEVLDIKPPNQHIRKEILTSILRNRTAVSKLTEDNLNWDLIQKRTEGYVAKDLENIVSRAMHQYILNKGKAPCQGEDVVLTQTEFDVAMYGFAPAAIRNVPLHTAGELEWTDVGGLDEVKKTLIETFQWPSKYPVLFSNSPLRLRTGLMLYGAPGTGKTLLAGVVAKECGLNFISIKGPEMLSKYIGASEQAVRDTFIRAQSAKPCILFFDEFDSIAPRRGHDNTGVTDRVVNQLLTQLDGVEGLDGVYVLAATSRPDLIDPALLRPGRLDKCLRCDLPNEEERLKILHALTRRMTLGDDIDLQYFAKYCEHFTGADFKALLYNAQLEAIHGLTGKYFQEKNPIQCEMQSERLNIDNETKLEPICSEVQSAMFDSADDTNIDHDKRQEIVSPQLLRVMTKPKPRSQVNNKNVAYIPKLEEGVIKLSTEMEEKLSIQINQIRAKANRSLGNIHSIREQRSPLVRSRSNVLLLSQSHLLKAANKMGPSVSERERTKYKRIYENFLSSRGNFGLSIPDAGSKQTLA